MLHAVAIFKNHVAITALVGVQKTLLGAGDPLPVRIIGEHKNIFDAPVDEVCAFNKIDLSGLTHFLKNTRRDHRQFVTRVEQPPVLH